MQPHPEMNAKHSPATVGGPVAGYLLLALALAVLVAWLLDALVGRAKRRPRR